MSEISFMYLIKLAWRRIWALILLAVIFAVAAYSYCEFLATPKYEAKAAVLVTNGTIISNALQNSGNPSNSYSVSGSDIGASLNLADTITDILSTSDIFKLLSDEIDNKYDYKQLRSMAKVTRSSDDSLFVNVTFTASTDKEAIKLVNSFIALAPDYITKYIPYSNAMVASTADTASVVFPKTMVTVMMAGIAGALIAFGIVFLIDSMDHAINGEEDFVSKYDIPLLGSIPDFENTLSVSNSNYYKKGGYSNAAKG